MVMAKGLTETDHGADTCSSSMNAASSFQLTRTSS